MVTADNVSDVTNSWELVKAFGLQEAGVAFFLKIFEIAPGALELFSFKGDKDDLANSEKLKGHALKVMTTVGVAVAGLKDLGALVPVLEGLGAKHKPYGVIAAHYDIVGQALLATLESALGDAWTPPVKEAWTTVYGVVSSTMIKGAKYEEEA